MTPSAGTVPPRVEQAVLVTGGAGFIGRHLVARLLGEGAWVVMPDRRTTATRPWRHTSLTTSPTSTW